VQLRYKSGLTSEEYVSQQAWRLASLERCPLHPRGDCGFVRHGTYARKEPEGTRIPRWYCPEGKVTFSLLADCFASRVSGTLLEIEAVVTEVEELGTVEAAAHVVRHNEVCLPSAIRWTRRRLNAVRATLVTLIGLMPHRFTGCEPTLASFRRALGVELVLVELRGIAGGHLAALGPPIGFGPRPKPAPPRQNRDPHDKGPDPPPSKQ
jgi:hypothetical protein